MKRMETRVQEIEHEVARHYSVTNMAARILDALTASGVDIAELKPADLAPFEELHIGGREATAHLAGKLNLEAGHRVLDVGCGIGGAARYIADYYGCRVTGLDLTPSFIRAAETLTAMVGLDDLVSFDVGSALDMPYEDNQFDAVISLHVAMNIANRAALYREMARVLKPGRPAVIYDIMKKKEGELLFPVPWAESSDTSYLVTPEEMHKLLAQAGLRVIESEDHTTMAIRFFYKVLGEDTQITGTCQAPQLAMRGSKEKMRNTLFGIEQGLIGPVMMLATHMA